MVTCGHQFHTGDESDWLISSSATCPIDGNTTAAKILRKLIRYFSVYGPISLEKRKNAFEYHEIQTLNSQKKIFPLPLHSIETLLLSNFRILRFIETLKTSVFSLTRRQFDFCFLGNTVKNFQTN